MSKLKKEEKKNKDGALFGGNYALIPVLLVILIVPLIVRAYEYNPKMSDYPWALPGDTALDLFLFWKCIIFIAIAFIMAAILIGCLVTKKWILEKKIWILLLCGYGALTFISTIVSPYSSYGFNGISEQFESVWVILSYCIVTIYTFYVVRQEKDLKIITKALSILLIILSIIGFFQLIGHDFFETDLGKCIIVGEALADYRDSLSFRFSDTGIHQVFLTFYNPNYVGVFAALLLPVTIMIAFISKKIGSRILWSVLSFFVFVITLGSGSKSFILTAAGLTIVAVIILRKQIFRHRKPALIATALILATFTGYFFIMKVNPFTYVKNALIVPKDEPILNALEIRDDGIYIEYKGTPLHLTMDYKDKYVYLDFYGNDNQKIENSRNDTGFITLKNEAYDGLCFNIYKGTGDLNFLVGMIINNNTLLFSRRDSGYVFVNGFGKEDEINYAPSAVIKEHNTFLSGRGYIWSRAFPLLSKHLLLGSGADSFTIVFPQDDYLGKLNAGYWNTIITKPHNLYLQIGIQHGGLALLCFLGVCIIYLVQSLRLYIKADFSKTGILLGTGIMLGILGYLITGITNDSCVALAPLFWTFLGIGFAMNRINKETAPTE